MLPIEIEKSPYKRQNCAKKGQERKIAMKPCGWRVVKISCVVRRPLSGRGRPQIFLEAGIPTCFEEEEIRGGPVVNVDGSKC